jgi:hypothetical protein
MGLSPLCPRFVTISTNEFAGKEASTLTKHK